MRHDEIVIDKHYPGLNPILFGYQDCTPCHSYGPTVRTYWILHYVVSGTGIFCRDGKKWHLKPGEVFVIPPYVETYYEADADDPWSYIWIGFLADTDLPESFAEPVFRCAKAGNIFGRMRSCSSMKNGKSAFLSSCLWELLCAVMEQRSADADFIEEALSIIHSEYANPINVGQIARRIGLDRSYFTTSFKHQLGKPPAKYLADLRLEKARELMVDYAQPPAVAAASVGYTDICSFSKAFKRKFGTPPREYKKENCSNK